MFKVGDYIYIRRRGDRVLMLVKRVVSCAGHCRVASTTTCRHCDKVFYSGNSILKRWETAVSGTTSKAGVLCRKMTAAEVAWYDKFKPVPIRHGSIVNAVVDNNKVIARVQYVNKRNVVIKVLINPSVPEQAGLGRKVPRSSIISLIRGKERAIYKLVAAL